jgi:ubiquinone/menaquinone biosynthesis C-methylase UbiE
MLTKEDFVYQALEYKKKLVQPMSLDLFHDLWRSISFPYCMESSDPYSNEYKNEVKFIYECLTSKPYEVSNELTSVLQTSDDFKVGYPWISKSLRVVASELGKSVQAIKIISEYAPSAKSFVEFGSGWGNLAIPLARSSMDVTIVDIDPGFLLRAQDEATHLNIKLNSLSSDFNSAPVLLSGKKFDGVIFCSSFHHCLDFVNLLEDIRDNILSPSGSLFFFAEPVDDAYGFPWGLRFDGESIWAVTCNSWLELGFSEEFFRSLFPRLGFSLTEVDAYIGLGGRAWVAKLL